MVNTCKVKFSGEIDKNLTLYDVFETLGEHRHGFLWVEGKQGTVCFYFEHHLVGLQNFPLDALQSFPEKLYYAGKISLATYRFMKRQTDTDRLLESIPSADEKKYLIKTASFDQICQFFCWKQGQFRFINYDDEQPAEIAQTKPEMFNIRDLLMEAARCLDEQSEVARCLPDFGEMLVINKDIIPPDDLTKNIFALIANFNIQESLQFAYTTYFETLKQIYHLYQEGILRIQSEQELLILALNYYKKSDWRNAVKYLKILLKRNIYQEQLQDYLIKCYKKLHDTANLLQFYNQTAEILSSSSDKTWLQRRANYLKDYIQATTDADSKLLSRVKLIHLMLEHFALLKSIPYNIRQETQEIVAILLTKNQIASAITLLNQTKNYDTSLKLYEQYINLLSQNKNNTQQIIIELESLAKAYENQNNFKAAILTYHRLSDYNLLRQDICETLQKLQILYAQRQKQYKYILTVIISTIILIIFVYFYWQYQQEQNIQLRIQQDKILEEIAQGNCKLASEMIATLPASYQTSLQETVRAKQTSIDTNARSLLQQAESTLEHGEIQTSLQLLDEAQNLKPSEDLCQKIQVKRYEATYTLQKFQEKLKIAQDYEHQLDYELALAEYLQIWYDSRFNVLRRQYPIYLPINITITPPTAKIMLDNKPVTLTNTQIVYCPPDFQVLEISHSGYKSQYFYNGFSKNHTVEISQYHNRQISPLTQATLVVKLSKAVEWSGVLNYSVIGTPHYIGNILYFISQNGLLCALNLAEKKSTILWTKQIAPNITVATDLCYADGIFYIASTQGNIYAFDTKEHLVIGKYTLEQSSFVSNKMRVAPYDKLLIVGSNTGQIYALPLLHKFDPNWSPIWKFPTSKAITTSTVTNQQVIVGNTEGTVYVLKASTGDLIWKTTLSSPLYSNLTIYNDTGYFVNAEYIYSLELEHGGQLWKSNINGVCYSNILYWNDMIYFSTYEGGVYCFNKQGLLQWQNYDITMNKNDILISKHNLLYITNQQGYLYAINPKNGRLFWQYSIGEPIETAPIQINNTIIIYAKSLYTFLDN